MRNSERCSLWGTLSQDLVDTYPSAMSPRGVTHPVNVWKVEQAVAECARRGDDPAVILDGCRALRARCDEIGQDALVGLQALHNWVLKKGWRDSLPERRGPAPTGTSSPTTPAPELSALADALALLVAESDGCRGVSDTTRKMMRSYGLRLRRGAPLTDGQAPCAHEFADDVWSYCRPSSIPNVPGSARMTPRHERTKAATDLVKRACAPREEPQRPKQGPPASQYAALIPQKGTPE